MPGLRVQIPQVYAMARAAIGGYVQRSGRKDRSKRTWGAVLAAISFRWKDATGEVVSVDVTSAQDPRLVRVHTKVFKGEGYTLSLV